MESTGNILVDSLMYQGECNRLLMDSGVHVKGSGPVLDPDELRAIRKFFEQESTPAEFALWVCVRRANLNGAAYMLGVIEQQEAKAHDIGGTDLPLIEMANDAA